MLSRLNLIVFPRINPSFSPIFFQKIALRLRKNIKMTCLLASTQRQIRAQIGLSQSRKKPDVAIGRFRNGDTARKTASSTQKNRLKQIKQYGLLVMDDSVWAAAEYEWHAAALWLKSLRLQRALVHGRVSSVLKDVTRQDTAMTWN